MAIFLRQVAEFRLALALYNDPLARDARIRSLTEELAAAGVRVLTLDLREITPGQTLLGGVKALVQQAAATAGQPLAVMVVNLESRVDYSPELARPDGPGTEFLETANLHRELFPEACPGPLVIWMTELLERALVRHAPDLWHWRSHVFDLRTRRAPDSAGLLMQDRPLPSHDFRLHPAERLLRLEEELVGYRKARMLLEEGRVLNSMGLARLDQGEAQFAVNDFTAALEITRQIKDRRGEGNALFNSADELIKLGQRDEALRRAEAALALFQATESPHAAQVQAALEQWRGGMSPPA